MVVNISLAASKNDHVPLGEGAILCELMFGLAPFFSFQFGLSQHVAFAAAAPTRGEFVDVGYFGCFRAQYGLAKFRKRPA